MQEANCCISRPVADVKPCSHLDRASGFKLPDVTIEFNGTLSMPGYPLLQKIPASPTIAQGWASIPHNRLSGNTAGGGK